MLLGTVTKQPLDRIDFDVDFSEWLTERGGDALGTVAGKVSDPALLLIGRSHDGSKVKQWIEGGEDGGIYTVTLTATTNGGRVKEVEIRVRVRERR